MPENLLSRFVKGTFFTSSGRLITVLLGFVCVVIYARWLPDEDYGSFVMLQVVIGLGLNVGSLGINTAITKFIASTTEQKEHQVILSSATLFNVFTLSLLSLLIIVTQSKISDVIGGIIRSEFIVFIPILLLIEGVLANYSAALNGLFHFKSLGAIEFFMSLVSLLVTVVTVIWMDMGVMGLIWARLISRAFSLLITMWALHVPFTLFVTIKKLREMLKYCFPIFINYIVDSLYSRTDTILIGILLGSAEIAIYEYARKIPESISMMYESFRVVYFPTIVRSFAEGKSQQVALILNTSNRLMSFFGSLGSLFVMGFGALLLQFLFSERYVASAPAFSVLMIGLTFSVLDQNLGYTLIGIGESNKPPLINTFRMIISFIGYFLFIPLLGNVGAALGTLLGTASVNPVNVFFLRKKKIDVRVEAYLNPLLIFITCGLGIYLFGEYEYLTGVLGIILFVVFSMMFTVVTNEDIFLIKREGKMLYDKFRKKVVQKPLLNGNKE